MATYPSVGGVTWLGFLRCVRFPIVLAALACASGGRTWAADEFPAIFADHMVLQRDQPIRIWGRTTASLPVVGMLGAGRAETRASESGEWELVFPPMPASREPLTLVIQAAQQHRFADVLIGDVWLFSGQSNMNWPLGRTIEADEDLRDATIPALRLFNVGRAVADTLAFKGEGEWRPATPEAANGFSAIAFLAGRRLHREQGVPVGLIQATWGGTSIRVWLPARTIATEPGLKFVTELWERELAEYPRRKQEFEAALPALMAEWEVNAARAREEGRNPPAQPRLRTGPGTQYQPAGLHAGMIAPVQPLALRGVVWYQGESDTRLADRYKEMLAAMVRSWREGFRNDRLPFVIVQLPNYRRDPEPGGEGWPHLREAQLKVAQSLHDMALVTTIDVGDPDDIHPRSKRVIAERTVDAINALSSAPERRAQLLAPTPHTVERRDGKIIVTFSPPGLSLRAARPGEIGVVVAGADRRYVPAQVRAEGDRLAAWSPDVPDPVSVRYAFAGNPRAGLTSASGLPVTPFRLDDWPDDTVSYSAEALALAVDSPSAPTPVR